MNIQKAIQNSTRELQAEAIPSGRLEAEILLAHILKIQRLDLYKFPERELTEAQALDYQALINQRLEGIPSAYLRGKKDFFSLEFDVGPGVLIPRADTELLVEEALKLLSPMKSARILDLGTGSGAIIISILVHHSGVTGVAADFSPAALDYAKKNATKHHLMQRLTFLEGNLFEPVKKMDFDLIVSNPPYIPRKEISPLLRFEPREALDGGADGFDFTRKIIQESPSFLKAGGHLLLEVGNVNRTNLEEILKPHAERYEMKGYRKDLGGRPRVCILRKN